MARLRSLARVAAFLAAASCAGETATKPSVPAAVPSGPSAVDAGEPSPVVPTPPPSTGELRGVVSMQWGADDVNRCVPDVAGALAGLRPTGDVLGFHLAGFTDDLLYFPGSSRHWQGVQRVAHGDGRGVILSRGGTVMFAAVQYGSRNGDGLAFGSNRVPTSAVPDVADRIVAEVPQIAGFEHAGGMAALGKYLAVPLENGKDPSRVLFFDVATTAAPAQLASFVRAPDLLEAGGVALGKLAGGGYLMAIAHFDANEIAWYSSPSLTAWSEDQRLGVMDATGYVGHEHGVYQTIALVTQCDGTLFLLGTHSTSKLLFGEDHVDAWRVVSPSTAHAAPTLAWVGDHHVTCTVDGVRQCNFGAAAGIYVDPAGRLIVDSAEQEASGPSNGDKTVKMMEITE